MKTNPMSQQIEGERRLLAAPQYFALGAEQGTGKTWMLLNDAEHQFTNGRIQALLVIAPKGVHTNWVRREIPTHLSVPHVTEWWASGMGKRHAARLERLLQHDEPGELVIFAINIDAVNTKPGLAYAERFLRRFSAMLVVDESHMIKNVSSKRTIKINSRLAPLAKSRRIASGTLVANSPLDLFGQFEFLRAGLLGTTSYRSFVAEYAEIYPPDSRLVANIQKRTRGEPQIVRVDRDGNPMYKNLQKLGGLIAPHTFRVLKEDCLDLPPKIYQTHYYDLNPSHRRTYDRIAEELRYEREDGEIDIYSALTVIQKLRQITSGFIMVEGEPTELTVDAEPRMKALEELVGLGEGPMIVWASFREELRQIAARLRPFGPVVEYHGGVSSKQRDQAVDDFQSGAAQFFVANAQSGGTGLTLTAARRVAYYSCSYSLVERLQSEDRAHRIGTTRPVVYTDIVATNTIDERIARVLQSKERAATTVMDVLKD